jgi:hypothetical protein
VNRAAFTALLACSCTAAGPTATVREVIAASRAGDAHRVYARLSASVRDQLRVRARRATEQTAGRRVFVPEDLLSVGVVAPAWEPTRVREGIRTGDSAEVELQGGPGERATVRLVREHGEWLLAGF